MNKYELLEEMKNNMINLITRTEIPIEVKQELQSYCDRLKNVIVKYNSNPESILEYIDINYGYIDKMLETVQNDKTNEVASDIIHKYRTMEQKLAENEEENDEINREEFKEIVGGKNNKATKVILETFFDYIRDVSNRASNKYYGI